MFVETAIGDDQEPICALDATVTGNLDRRGLLTQAIYANQCWVARTGGTVASFAVLERSFYGHAFVSLVVVHSDYRRRGAASALIRRIESTCPNEKLFTSTNRSNVAMQQVLEKLGFVQSGYIENLDKGDPEIVYFKNTGRVP